MKRVFKQLGGFRLDGATGLPLVIIHFGLFLFPLWTIYFGAPPWPWKPPLGLNSVDCSPDRRRWRLNARMCIPGSKWLSGLKPVCINTPYIYEYIYICIYVYIYVYIYIYIYVSISIYIYMYPYLYICIYVCIHIYICIHIIDWEYSIQLAWLCLECM